MTALQERLERHLGKNPQIDPSAYVHPTAVLIGDVRLGPHVVILPYVVLRADLNFIEVGAGSNLQDGSIVHLSDDWPVRIGTGVTIGHGAIIHACTVESGTLVGMRATLLDGCVIGQEAVVGAGTLVTRQTQVPARSMILGLPGKIVRSLTESEVAANHALALKYQEVGRALRAKLAERPPSQ